MPSVRELGRVSVAAVRPAALPALLAALAVAGCDALRPFEAVCEKRLPPTRVEVLAAPVGYTTDLSLAAAELSGKGAHTFGRTLMGLTLAELKSTVEYGGSGIADRGGQRVCMRPAVKVRLSFSPMTVYVAREHPPGSCAYRVTLEHELKHVSVYEQYLAGIAHDIEAALRQELGARVLYFRSEAEGDAHVRKVLEERIGPYVEDTMLRVVALQRQVDSPEEYARLDRAQAECEAAAGKN